MEEAERSRTGINSLKIRYNRVFGYYIEISKSNLANVPGDYLRKQTIAGGERFITPALKEHRGQGARRRRADPRTRARAVRCGAQAGGGRGAAGAGYGARLAALDVLTALAETAGIHNYIKPVMHAGDELVASDARHPIVERHSPESFVPNDVTLDGTSEQLVILTGPNMGGKSTYLRQTALLSLMAQAGSSWRREAQMPIVDRILRGLEPPDNIARPVDVHGRDAGDREHPALGDLAQPRHPRRDRAGTATFDGLSLAWAVADAWLQTRKRARRPSSPRTTTSSPIWQTRCPRS